MVNKVIQYLHTNIYSNKVQIAQLLTEQETHQEMR